MAAVLFHCPQLVDDREPDEIIRAASIAAPGFADPGIAAPGEAESDDDSDEEDNTWLDAPEHFFRTTWLGSVEKQHEHRLRESRLAQRLEKQDSCMVHVKPDLSSIYMGLAEVLRRRNSSSSWMNVRREIWAYMKKIGDLKVKPDLTVQSWISKMDWDSFVRDGARATSFQRFRKFAPAVLLAASALYRMSITVISGVEEVPDMRFFPPDSWKITQERSPALLGHLGGEIFVAVQTMTASIRAQLRTKKGEKRIDRMQAAQKREEMKDEEEMKDALKGGDAVIRLAVEEKDKRQLIQDLLAVPPGVKRNTLEMVRDDRVREKLEKVDLDDIFETLFETKCIFDLFDNDCRGSVSLAQMEYAFQGLGLNLQNETPVAEGGVGSKTHDALRRQFGGGAYELTLASFTKMIVDEKNSVSREVVNLLEQLNKYEDEDGEYVVLDELNQILQSLGADMEGLDILDQVARANPDPLERPSALLDNKIRIEDLERIGNLVE